MERKATICLLSTLVLIAQASSAFSQMTRIKDLTSIKGVRSNQLLGIGVVTGLSATGDSAKSLVTNQAVSQMLSRLGVHTASDLSSNTNMAAVIATAELPPFAKIGDRLDIKISALGDATSLAGGTLILTPLRAGDQQVYVMAQGAVVVGQASGSGPQVLSVARIPRGGVVEREFLPHLAADGFIDFSLRQADFTTNTRLAEVINLHLRGFFAKSIDPATVRVEIPAIHRDGVISFISEIERLPLEPDVSAKVVLNERTGTVVMGAQVRVAKVAIAHGDLTIQVGTDDSNVKSAQSAVVEMGGATVGSLVQSLNALGVKAADLVSILQAIKAAGALDAELEFM